MPVHREVLAEGHRQLELGIVHVAHLHDMDRAVDLRPSTHSGRRQIDIEILDQIERTVFDLLKGLNVKGRGLVDVGQTAFVLLEIIHQGVRVPLQNLIESIGSIPVGQIKRRGALDLAATSRSTAARTAAAWEPRHSFGIATSAFTTQGSSAATTATATATAIKADIGEIEATALREVRNHRTQAVAFPCRGKIAQRPGHLDVRIERIEHGRLPILGVVDEEGNPQPRLERQELGQFQIGL